MAAQISEREVIVAIKQCRLGLQADSNGPGDFADEAATQLVDAHRCAGDRGWAVLKFTLPIWVGRSRHL
jgi:hypothetical protein